MLTFSDVRTVYKRINRNALKGNRSHKNTEKIREHDSCQLTVTIASIYIVAVLMSAPRFHANYASEANTEINLSTSTRLILNTAWHTRSVFC